MNKVTKSIYINFALLKEPQTHGLSFDEARQSLLEAEPSFKFQSLIGALSEAFDIKAYSMMLSEKDVYEAETWLVDHDFSVDEVKFKPDNYYGKHVDGVLDLIGDDVLFVFETQQSIVQVLRDNGLEVFEYV